VLCGGQAGRIGGARQLLRNYQTHQCHSRVFGKSAFARLVRKVLGFALTLDPSRGAKQGVPVRHYFPPMRTILFGIRRR
jgi:hypothetical protein